MKQPMTRDGVLLKVGDKVFTHTAQEKRDSEVVYIEEGQVVVRDDGILRSVNAWLCWGRAEAMLQVQREMVERQLQSARETAAAIPGYEAKLIELDDAIQRLG